MSNTPQGETSKLLKAWIRGRLTGCGFAKLMLQEQGIHVQEFQEPPNSLPMLELLDRQLERAGQKNIFVIVSLPHLNSDARLIEWLGQLKKHERWRVQVLSSDPVTTEVQIEWKTEAGYWSNCMGLAPTLTMPPTRRAPYIGLALWPGKKSKPKGTRITFRDIPDPESIRDKPEARQEMLANTKARKKALFENTPDREWREISFSLATGACAPLFSKA